MSESIEVRKVWLGGEGRSETEQGVLALTVHDPSTFLWSL